LLPNFLKPFIRSAYLIARLPANFLFLCKSFLTLKFLSRRLCVSTQDADHTSWESLSPKHSVENRLHKKCAIRIIVLNFAELLAAEGFLSTNFSTILLKT